LSRTWVVEEACGRLGNSPVRDAFAKPANPRFHACWTREDDAFAHSWDYATADPLWANPLFSRMQEVVEKAARDGCLMLIIAPEWPGPSTRGVPRYAPWAPRGGSATGPAPVPPGEART